MTFASARAGSLPTVEGPWFAQGVLDAGGEEADVYPFGDGLVVAHLIELDEGYRVVTASQRARWGATADRVQKAAASSSSTQAGFAYFEPIDGDTAVSRCATASTAAAASSSTSGTGSGRVKVCPSSPLPRPTDDRLQRDRSGAHSASRLTP